MSYLYMLIFLIPVLGVPLGSYNQSANLKIMEIPSENTNLPESETEVRVTPIDEKYSIETSSSEEDGSEHITLWKESIIYYQYLVDTTEEKHRVSNETKEVIQAAMNYLQDFSCLTFKQILNQGKKPDAYLMFTTHNDTMLGECWSYARRLLDRIGPSLVGVSPACDKGVVTHLIIRALGIIDEHRRPDRDDYVELLPDNFENAETYQEIAPIQDNDMFFKFPYDYNSITHLSPTQYSKSKGKAPTIKAKKENGKIAFQEETGRTLSILDVIKINTAFGCFNTTAHKFSPKQMRVELSRFNKTS